MASSNVSAPHYLLFSQLADAEPGGWRFVLRCSDGSQRLEAHDVEPGLHGERLELLTVVRGLEALEQPSRVTLVTASTYVREGIRHGLSEWRGNGWRWERFGQMVPVKNLDLWQRVDRALQYHEVDCRTCRFDPPHQGVSPGLTGEPNRPPEPSCPLLPRRRLQYRLAALVGRLWAWTQGGTRANQRGPGGGWTVSRWQAREPL